LNGFSYLALRDHESYLTAKEMDLPFEPVAARDLAGVLPIFLGHSQDRERTRLGISLCNYERYKSGCSTREKSRNTAISEGILAFSRENGVPVTVFVLNTHPVYGDREISMQLAVMLRENGVDAEVESLDSGPLHLWEKIGGCRAFFSVRLHGAISAYLQNVPFSLVEYHGKCSAFLEDVGQHGSNRLPPEGFGAAAVCRVLEQIFFGETLPAMPTKEYISCALTNFTEAPWVSKP
jgi:polysaccharide pyruvyl transferase WcaK-like protein